MHDKRMCYNPQSCGAGASTKPALRRTFDNVAKIWCCSQWRTDEH